MPKEIISPEEASMRMQAETPVEKPEEQPSEHPPEPVKRGRGRPPKNRDEPDSVEPVTFRTGNIGLVYFPDGSTFAFHKPILTVSDPQLIAKLTEVASRPQTIIHIHDPENL